MLTLRQGIVYYNNSGAAEYKRPQPELLARTLNGSDTQPKGWVFYALQNR
jgi:hypothetical protein